MKLKYLLSGILVAISLNCYGQCPGSNTRVYSLNIGRDRYGENHIAYYDYVSGEQDTIFRFYGQTITNALFGSAIDPYNGRYFLLGNLDTITTVWHLLTIDLIKKSLTVSKSQFSINEIGGIEYDAFSNRLLFADELNGLLKYIDLEKDIINPIFSIPASTYRFGHNHRTFNQRSQKYIYITPIQKPNYGYKSGIVAIDVPQGHLFLDTNDEPDLNIIYNIGNDKYLGVKGNAIISFDPYTQRNDSIASLKGGWSNVNEQKIVVDGHNNIMLIPYYNWNLHKARLLAVNCSNKEIIMDTIYTEYANLQEFLGLYDPLIKDDGKQLTTTYGASYQWYRNGKKIPNATNQSYTPTKNGTYEVEVVFECGRKAMSADFAIRNNLAEDEVLIYPLPATDKITVSFPNDKHLKHKLILYNIIGQTIQTFITTEEKIIINRGSMASGVYGLKLFNEHIKLTEAKIVFE